MFRLALLLCAALAVSAAEYKDRKAYAAANDVVLEPTLVEAKLPAACKASSGIYMENTDLFSGDIQPTIEVKVDFDVGGGDVFPDTVVAASTPEACCTMCHLHPDCSAFTFASPEDCSSEETPWLKNAPGCCYLKRAVGYEKRASKGLTSGVLPGRKRQQRARCALIPESDTQGADLVFDPILPDTVVPAATAADCCDACAALGGCAAFTLTPSSFCDARRLGAANPGCCFLKPAKGWRAVSDNSTAFFTSGRLRR